MAAHGDETDDSHLRGRFHPGCGIVPAALATAEIADRSGNDLLRAVALGYDIGARLIFSLGLGKLTPPAVTAPTPWPRRLVQPQRRPQCCGLIRAGCAMRSHLRLSKHPAFRTGR